MQILISKVASHRSSPFINKKKTSDTINKSPQMSNVEDSDNENEDSQSKI